MGLGLETLPGFSDLSAALSLDIAYVTSVHEVLQQQNLVAA